MDFGKQGPIYVWNRNWKNDAYDEMVKARQIQSNS